MEKNMKAIEKQENFMDKKSRLRVIEMSIEVSLLMGYSKVLEYLKGQMEKNMKVIEELEKSMDKESGLGEKEMFMKESM